MKKILYLFLLLLPVLGFAQSRYGVEGVPMCWTTSLGVDSSIIRYVLVSTTGQPVKTIVHENASGVVVNVSGGTLRYGFCDCAGGLDSLANGSVTWAKLANAVKDSIRIGMNPKKDTSISFVGNYNLSTAVGDDVIQRRYRKITLSGEGPGNKVTLTLPDGGLNMTDVDLTVVAANDTIQVQAAVNDQIYPQFRKVNPGRINEYKCVLIGAGTVWKGSVWDSLGVGGGGGSNLNYYDSYSLAAAAASSLANGSIVEVKRDTTTAGASRTRYIVSSGVLTQKTVLTNFVIGGLSPYIQNTDTTTVPDVFVSPNGSSANNGRLKSTPKQTIPTGVTEAANTTNKLTYIQKGTYTNGTFAIGSGNKIFGQRDTFPIIYEGVRVKSWLATSNANTYKKSLAHTIGNSPNYNHIEVYEIDTALYRISPVLGRKMLKYYRNYDTTLVFANRGSYTFRDLTSPTWVYIRPTSGNINSNKYRYELILSEARITMGGQTKNEVKNIHFIGTGNGYGNIDGGFDLKIDGVIFEGGNTHSTVQASGLIKNSLFYDHFTSVNDNLASVFYTSTGTGLVGQFYNDCFIDVRDGVYNHTEAVTRYREAIIDNNSMFGNKLKEAKTGIGSSNTQRMIARNNYVEYFDVLLSTQTDTAYWYGNCLVNGQLAQTPFFQPIIYATKNVVYNGVMSFSAKQFENNVVVNTVAAVSPSGISGSRIVGNIFINRDTQQINAISQTTITGVIDSLSRNVYILANRDASFRWFSGTPLLNTTDINVVKAAGLEQGSIVIDLTSNPDELYSIFKDPDNGDFTLIPFSKYYSQILNCIQVDGIIARRQAKPTIEQAIADMREVGFVRKLYSARKSPVVFNTFGGSKFTSNTTSIAISPAANSASSKNVTLGYNPNNAAMLPTGSKSIGIQVAGNSLGNLPTRLDSSIFIGINKTSRGTLSRSIYIGLNPPANENDYMSIGDSYGIQRFLQGHASYGQAYLFPDQPNKIFVGWSLGLHTNVSNLPTNVMVLGNRQITDWLLGSHSDAGPGVTQLRASSKRVDNPNTGYAPATQYFRIIGPSSVGTGVGGSMRLAVTPSGASGSTLNAAFDAITIYGADGNVGISNITSPTAKLHIAAGTATASTAPLKFTSGTILTTPEAGVVEFDGVDFYGTDGTRREKFLRGYKGSGSPEGVVTAPVGSIYLRTDGGAGTTFYVKESGTGNTGWVAK